MADSFFGFDASLPSLGEGYRDDDQASAIDLLNDETFGDGALEGDWEEFHDHFVGVDPNGGTNTKQTNDLEDSLNHLVLDDEEDDNGGFGRGIPMKQRRPADLDHLFGPASPPGLLNTEQLLSGQNIWGSPVTRESDVHRQQEDGLKSLLKQLQAPPQAHTSYLQNPSIASMQLSNSLPNAKSLHEIENTMMQGPPPSGDGRPRALTVEELEKQLQMSHPSGALQSSKIAPIGTPPTSGSYLQHNFRNMPGGMAPQAPRENPNIVLADMSQPPPGFNPLQQQPQQQPQRRVSPTNMAQPNTGGRISPFTSTRNALLRSLSCPPAPNTKPPISSLVVGNLANKLGRATPSPPTVRSPSPLLKTPSPPLSLMMKLPPSSTGTGAAPINNQNGVLAYQPQNKSPVSPIAESIVTKYLVAQANKAKLQRSLSQPANGTMRNIQQANANLGNISLSTNADIRGIHQPFNANTANISQLANSNLGNGVHRPNKNLLMRMASLPDNINIKPPLARRNSENFAACIYNDPNKNLASQKTSYPPMVGSKLQRFLDTQSSVKGGTSPPSNSTPFLANTPVQQRMPAPVAPNTDPTHQRGRTQNTQPGGNVRQNLFNNAPRGKPAQPNGVNNGHQQQPQQQQRQYNNYHDRDNRGNNHHDNYDNRDTFRDNRDNFRDNRDNYRDNYRDRGNNYHDNDYYHDNHHYRGDHRDFNHRGYHDNRGGGDFHRDYDRDFGNRDRYDRDFNRDYQRDYRKRGPGQHHYHRQRYDSQGYDDEEMYDDRGDGRDEYAGLMSKKEKDWIIKIQLMQLQTENPYLDDFYYTTWQLKKMHTELEKKRLAGKLSKDKNSEPKLVLPHLEGKAENKNYKPVQFENSLGRLTAASVHNPRQALQLAKSNSLDKDDKNKEVKKIFKGLLIDVEKCYDALLEIDDIEKRVLALPQESRMPLLEDRHHIINQLFGHLACENNNQSQFLKYLSLRKGVTFIARLLPLLSKEDALSMVRAVLRNLSTISKREWQDEVLPRMLHTMSCVIDEVDLEGLVGLAAALLATNGADPSINHALQNNFGVSVICGLVSRGEEIYTTCNPLQLDVQHQNAWRQFILKLADAVHGTAQTQLVHPTTCAASSLPLHMRRLVDKQTYFSIQDKLQQLTTTA